MDATFAGQAPPSEAALPLPPGQGGCGNLVQAAGGGRGTLRVGLHSFVMLRCLGKGSSGTAELVRRKADGVLLVLKVIEVIPPPRCCPSRHRRTHRTAPRPHLPPPTSIWPVTALPSAQTATAVPTVATGRGATAAAAARHSDIPLLWLNTQPAQAALRLATICTAMHASVAHAHHNCNVSLTSLQHSCCPSDLTVLQCPAVIEKVQRYCHPVVCRICVCVAGVFLS